MHVKVVIHFENWQVDLFTSVMTKGTSFSFCSNTSKPSEVDSYYMRHNWFMHNLSHFSTDLIKNGNMKNSFVSSLAFLLLSLCRN